MADNKEQERQSAGQIKISEDVVAIVADKAVREVEGITGLTGGFASNIAAVLGKKSGPKGIDVEIKENDVSISLHAVVKYGVRIPEVAWKAQEAVKTEVQNMTGLNVVKVNINIEGVEILKEDAPPEDADQCEAQGDATEDSDDELISE